MRLVCACSPDLEHFLVSQTKDFASTVRAKSRVGVALIWELENVLVPFAKHHFLVSPTVRHL